MTGASGIYQIRNTATGKVYVGSAVHIGRRWSLHKRRLNAGKHHSQRLQNAWVKYGPEAFEFTVLEVVADTPQLLAREQHWLDATKAATEGMNISPTAGSLLGHRLSDESKQRMSDAAKGKKKTPEHAANIRNGLLGRTMTPEQRQKMRDARLGRKFKPHSAETKAKMSAAALGRRFTPEHREKLAAAKRGRKLPPETIARMSAAHKARLLAVAFA
jgi:group I intron endonuclease